MNNIDYFYLNNLVLNIETSTKFNIHIKTEKIRIESDGYVYFCNNDQKICCADGPILYMLDDWIAYLKFVMNSAPVPNNELYHIGIICYNNILSETKGNNFKYCFMSNAECCVYLYKKDSDHYCIEITDGDPFREHPTPFHLIYRAELDTKILIEWLSILQIYAQH